MATRLSVAQQNAHADLAADAVDASATLPGYVEVYTGTQPATVATAATGTLLVAITFNDPAYGAAATGVAALDIDPVPSATAAADGTPGWYRIYDGDGSAVRDGSLTGATAIVAGQTVEIAAGSVTMPAST